MYVYIVHTPRNYDRESRGIILSKTKFRDNTIKFYHILSTYFIVPRNRSFVACIANFQNTQDPLYTYTSILLHT